MRCKITLLLLAIAALLPAIASPAAPSYAETCVWGFESETPAGARAERGLSPTGTKGYLACLRRTGRGLSPSYVGNNPINRIDLNGLERMQIQQNVAVRELTNTPLALTAKQEEGLLLMVGAAISLINPAFGPEDVLAASLVAGTRTAATAGKAGGTLARVTGFLKKVFKRADDVPGGAPKPGSVGGPGAGKRFSTKTKDAARAENPNCVFCDEPTKRAPGPRQSNIDHAQPKSRGGNSSLENAQNTCRTCNLKKGAQTTEEFLLSGGGS